MADAVVGKGVSSWCPQAGRPERGLKAVSGSSEAVISLIALGRSPVGV
jgi:hypothetical protein